MPPSYMILPPSGSRVVTPTPVESIETATKPPREGSSVSKFSPAYNFNGTLFTATAVTVVVPVKV